MRYDTVPTAPSGTSEDGLVNSDTGSSTSQEPTGLPEYSGKDGTILKPIMVMMVKGSGRQVYAQEEPASLKGQKPM